MEDERRFIAKLKDLLRIPTFNDITFNCKDGKIQGNRLILSVYSDFLVNVFKENPSITFHPGHNSTDSGIDLHEVKIKDIANLLKAMNGCNFVDIESNNLIGVQKLAQKFKIELVTGQSVSGLTSVKVLPKWLPECEKNLIEKNDDGPSKTQCEQSFVEDDNLLPSSAMNDVVIMKGESSSSLDKKVENHTQLNGCHNVSSANVTTSYQSFNLIFTKRNENCSEPKSKSLKVGMKDEIMKHCFEKDSENKLEDNDHVDNIADFTFAKRHENPATEEVQHKNFLSRQLSTIEPVDTAHLKIVDNCQNMVDNPDESSDCSTAEEVCPICKITCKSLPGLKNHIRKVHRNSGRRQALQKQLVCKCEKRFSYSSRTNYKEHRKNCKIYRKEAFICQQCTAPFGSMQALNSHKYSSHGVITKARTCVCGQSFNTGRSYRNHEMYCEIYRRTAICCGECNLPFLHKGHLRRHIQSTGHVHKDKESLLLGSSEKLILCKCGKTFSKHSSKSYKEHREKCTEFMKEAFICEICNSAFDEMPSLSNHKYTAHGILKETNSCVCGMTFGSSWSCRKHSIGCEKYRSAAIFCEECQLPFLTKGHLEQHLRSSTHQRAVGTKKNTSCLIKQ